MLLIWMTVIAAGTIWAAASARTAWWIGTISTVLLGPLGLLVIAADVATYKSPSNAHAGR